MPQGMRVAGYYAPPAHDPLWQLGCQWLGREPESDASLDQPDLRGIAELTADARLYGFHATLKPPMFLRPGVTWDAVVTAADDLAGRKLQTDIVDRPHTVEHAGHVAQFEERRGHDAVRRCSRPKRRDQFVPKTPCGRK